MDGDGDDDCDDDVGDDDDDNDGDDDDEDDDDEEEEEAEEEEDDENNDDDEDENKDDDRDDEGDDDDDDYEHDHDHHDDHGEHDDHMVAGWNTLWVVISPLNGLTISYVHMISPCLLLNFFIITICPLLIPNVCWFWKVNPITQVFAGFIPSVLRWTQPYPPISVSIPCLLLNSHFSNANHLVAA